MRISESSIAISSLMLAGFTLAACQASTNSQAGLPCPEAVPTAASPAPAVDDSLVAEVELHNPSNFVRPQEPVYLSYYDLGLNPAGTRAPLLAVTVGEAAQLSQHVDKDGDGQKDGLLVLVDFQAAETKSLRVAVDEAASSLAPPKLAQAEISEKQGGAWKPRADKPKLQEYVGGQFVNVPSLVAPPQHLDHSWFIRYEGPGIESDKVAYRIYLDWRNGFDVFGKKVTTPVLQQVGQDGFDSYHEMADWGMDILKVGKSLGAGGFGYVEGDKVHILDEADSRSVKITEAGGLYSALTLRYGGANVAGVKTDLDARFSMNAGSRLVHAQVRSSEKVERFALGVVKHPDTELLVGSTNIPGKAYTYLGSWGKQSLAGDGLGMAVLYRRGSLDKQLKDEASYAASVKPSGQDLDYYFLAAWQGEPGGIQNKAEFVQYLEQEAERLTIPVRQRLKTVASQRATIGTTTAESALGWAKKLADSELERKTLSYHFGGWDVNRRRPPRFEYDIVGLLPLAYDELAEVAPEPRYSDVLNKVSATFVTAKGDISAYDESEYNIDAVNPGRNLIRLYERTKEEKYKKAAQLLRRQLKNHPKTSEGAFWHKKKYPHQLWLDGVYMGMPFLAQYSKAFEAGASYDEVVGEFLLSRKHLRDPNTGLYYHAWDEKKQQDWADKTTGLSKLFWARGLGWLSMALVDVLEILPPGDEKHRRPLLDIVAELAPALARVQDPETGTWWQILDKPGAPGNYRESTASAMFTYFFAKAVRSGYLDASYQGVAQRGFDGLLGEFVNVHQDGKISMTNQCLVAGLGFGRDGSYKYYMSEPVYQNDPKGTGPFILAGVEIHRMLSAVAVPAPAASAAAPVQASPQQ